MRVALVGGPRAGLTFEAAGDLGVELVMLNEDPVVNELIAEVIGAEEGLQTATYRRMGYDPELQEMVYRFVEGRNGESALYSE